MRYLIIVFFLFFLFCSCKHKTKPFICNEIETYIQNKSFEKAKESIDYLEKKYGELPEIHYYKGLIYIQKGKYYEALYTLTKGLKIFPNFYRFNVAIANIKFLQSDFNSAIYYCTIAEKKDSTDFQISLFKALSYENLGDTILAISCFEKSYLLGLKDLKYHYNLGLLYFISKDIKKAKMNFNIACSSDENKACVISNFIKKYKNSQLIYFRNQFSICLPADFYYETYNFTDLFKLQAVESGLLNFQRFSIVEVETKSFIYKNSSNISIFECPLSELISNMRKQVNNFKLLETEKTRIDNIDCYFIKYSSNGVYDATSFIPHITFAWMLINPNNQKMTSISGFCNLNNNNDEVKWLQIFKEIIETFSFNKHSNY